VVAESKGGLPWATGAEWGDHLPALAVIASKAKRPRLGVSKRGFVWIVSLSLAMTGRSATVS
jgi:hypothetical protein